MTLFHFLYSESGATTVDWVVLTSALATLGWVTAAVVSGGIEHVAQNIDETLLNVEIVTRFE